MAEEIQWKSQGNPNGRCKVIEAEDATDSKRKMQGHQRGRHKGIQAEDARESSGSARRRSRRRCKGILTEDANEVINLFVHAWCCSTYPFEKHPPPGHSDAL